MKLTDHQHRVLDLVSQGLTSAEIAERLGKSAKSIEDTRCTIIRKFDARNLTHAVRKAFEIGVLTARSTVTPVTPASDRVLVVRFDEGLNDAASPVLLEDIGALQTYLTKLRGTPWPDPDDTEDQMAVAALLRGDSWADATISIEWAPRNEVLS